MLSQPILVSDEEQKKGEFIIHKTLLDKVTKCPDIYGSTQEHWYKVLAGIEGLPILDLSAIAEKIGWVDVEKLADEVYGDSMVGKGFWIEGFKANQSLNEKKFSLEDMFFIFNKGIEFCDNEVSKFRQKEFDKAIEIISQPKVFDVEVEMELADVTYMENNFLGGTPAHMYFPKITNNSIKIIKVL